MSDMLTLNVYPEEAFAQVAGSGAPMERGLNLISAMCRLNTLSSIKKAGSGHIGTSFSAMDLVVHLYYNKMIVCEVGIDSPDRDLYFSSKVTMRPDCIVYCTVSAL